MYLYLYDSFLNAKKYSGLLARIETRLTDLGIGGKIFRLSPLRNVSELLTDEVRNGIKTVVVVGNDKSITEVINVAARLDITLGIIPVGAQNTIAQMLGIGSAESACNILAARKVERVDLGKVNGTYFLSALTVAGNDLTIECEQKYRITPSGRGSVSICNLRPLHSATQTSPNHFDPQDGFLEVLVQNQPTGWAKLFGRAPTADSVIPFREIAITSRESVPVITDGQRVLKTPLQVKIVPSKLQLIVGKQRQF